MIFCKMGERVRERLPLFLLRYLTTNLPKYIIIHHIFRSNTREEIGPRLAKTMKNSGVAITVTSLTDFLAFAVGGTTTVPALESFCIFCGLGIVAVSNYVLNTKMFMLDKMA